MRNDLKGTKAIKTCLLYTHVRTRTPTVNWSSHLCSGTVTHGAFKKNLYVI